MSRKRVIFSIVGIVFFVGISIFYSGIGRIVYSFFSDFRYKELSIKKLQILNLSGISILIIISLICGALIAKKKNRNLYGWLTLCLLFNVWALIVLELLPPLARPQKGKR